jgi:WD40 repeat protein/DNA-binding SARP family transcriptional activator
MAGIGPASDNQAMGMDVRTLHFGVLGPLEASRDGRPVRLGGERQRALLALLLTRANELVTVQQLIEELFGDEPSERAANAVHAAISRLRRVLHSPDDPVLRTRPGGYVLELDGDQLDATVFERLLTEGRDLLADGDATAAASRLGEALALWRGPPLADLPALDLLEPEIRRLDELRLLAQMERIDADLALGQDEELIPEIQRLVDSYPLRERLRAQLMLALYRSGRQAESLAAYREASRMLRDELGLEPGPALQELERLVLQQDCTLASAASSGAPHDQRESVVCPFKGLASFDGSDAEYFCGREGLVSDLVARLAEWTLVGILGPSGIGKSSLLRAGLLPALRAGALPGSGAWHQVLLRPGAHPCDELARVSGDGGLPGLISLQPPGARVVIAIDQFEELFTVCQNERERGAFLEQLAAAAHDHERRVFVVLALRADFYGRVGRYPAFARLLSQSHVLVGPMDRHELTQAIVQPAARAGLEVAHALVDALVSDVVEEPGALPLLSTTLLELWLARDGRTLRFQTYQTTGGVRGAVSRLAEAAYTGFSAADQAVATSVLLRLAGDEGGALIRRRVPLAELERIDGAPRVLTSLVDARLLTVSEGAVELSHEALLSEWPRYRAWLEEDRVGRRLHSHLTAAAREWDAHGRDQSDLYRGARLTAALDWATQRRDLLNRSERDFIDASRTQADRETRRQRSQNRRLRALLIGTGILLIVSLVAGAIAVIKQRDANTAARLAAAEARAALGRELGAEAVDQPRIDVAMLLARESVALDRSPQSEGTLLSTLLRSPAVIGSFALPAGSSPLLALSPNGRTLAVGDAAAGTVRFYDTATHGMVPPLLSDFAGDQPPVYSSDGSLLAYPDGAQLRVRDARTLALLAKLAFDPRFSPVQDGQTPNPSILISPDHRVVYFAYWLMNSAGNPAGAYVDRWSLPSGRRLASTRVGTGPLLALRLVDGGSRLIVVSADGVDTYTAPALGPVQSVPIGRALGMLTAAAIGPGGHFVAVGSQKGAVSFVDASTGAERRAGSGQGAPVDALAYSANGKTVASVGDDNRVVVWDAAAGQTTSASGPLGQVQNAAISAQGTTLYTASLDGVVLAWDLSGADSFGRERPVGPSAPCCQPISPRSPPLAVSPDGTRFAVALGPSSVGVFSARTWQRLAAFAIKPAGNVITALAWSPDGSAVAVGGHSGVVQVWAVRGRPRPIRSLIGLRSLSGLPEAIQSIAFAPSGNLIAATDDEDTLSVNETAAPPLATFAIWQARTGALVAPPSEVGVGNGPGGSAVLAFSHDGKLLAVSLLHGGTLIFDAATGVLRHTLVDPSNDVIALAFARHGTLATGTLAGTISLWDAARGVRMAQPVLAASAPIASVAFDRTGRLLATSGAQDGTVKLWSAPTLQQEGPDLSADQGSTSALSFDPRADLLLAVDDLGNSYTWPASLSAWEKRACAVAGRNLTAKEWSRFVPELPYARVCP